MSDDIHYTVITTESCRAEGCSGLLLSDRKYVFYQCATCHETYTRLGLELVVDKSIPRAILVERDKK